MASAIDHLEHIRGETISFGLRSAAYVGTETVVCQVKFAINNFTVPPETASAVLSLAPTFVAAIGDMPAAWHFEITAAQSAGLTMGNYILDAKITFASGDTDITAPLGLRLVQGVTP